MYESSSLPYHVPEMSLNKTDPLSRPSKTIIINQNDKDTCQRLAAKTIYFIEVNCVDCVKPFSYQHSLFRCQQTSETEIMLSCGSSNIVNNMIVGMCSHLSDVYSPLPKSTELAGSLLGPVSRKSRDFSGAFRVT